MDDQFKIIEEKTIEHQLSLKSCFSYFAQLENEQMKGLQDGTLRHCEFNGICGIEFCASFNRGKGCKNKKFCWG